MYKIDYNNVNKLIKETVNSLGNLNNKKSYSKPLNKDEIKYIKNYYISLAEVVNKDKTKRSQKLADIFIAISEYISEEGSSFFD